MAVTRKGLIIGGLFALLICGLIAAGCAPKQAPSGGGSGGSVTAGGGGSDTSTDDTPAPVVVTWTPNIDCTTCHSPEQSSLTDKTTAAGIHNSEGLECMSCHDDVAGLTTAHAKVEAGQATAKRLKRTSVDNETCTASGCHDNDAERISLTASFTGLTDDNGTTVNPHALPETDQHKNVTCSSCHKGHASFDAASTVDTCFSCHHQKVFECGTCHD